MRSARGLLEAAALSAQKTNKQTNKLGKKTKQAETKQRSDGGAAISPLWENVRQQM